MQSIAEWLEKLGLGQYAQCFAENGIDLSDLRHLTDQDLKDIGILLGHRRRILAAIAEFARPTTPEPTVATKPKPQDFAERRQLTVMFCDLVGSTALSGRLDPEDLRGIIGAYHGCCTELIERNGGFVAKYMGDGVLAYFGYPQAHEHDTERAVRAGLDLVEAVPKLATNAGSPLQVRIGIATGLVVVGDLIGTGAAQEQAVVGDTPNLAARLQALAEPGAVVIASSTRRLTGGLFEYRDLDCIEAKGFAAPVHAYQVLRPSAVESRFEAMHTAMTPLVGREEEIELLLHRWQQAKAGDGWVVLISGEPGIGKSRIAQTVLERLNREPHTRLRLYCSPHHQDSALYPTISQLQRAAGFHRDDTDQQRLDKLEAMLAEATNDLSEAAPLLADLLCLPTGDRYPPLTLTPQKRKEKTLRALLAQLDGLAAHQPVLMVYEDVHWIDPTSLELLDLTVDCVTTRPVLLLITCRSEFSPPWIGRSHVTMLILNRLPRRQRAEMITQVTGGKVLPKEMADQIIDRTDGVPLFIEELTKAVVESGVLVDSGDRYTTTGPVAPLAIPTTLHASLLARLDRLAPTREAAQIGAALGRSFSHELISAVAGMPQQQIDEALTQLTNHELIFRRGTPPDAEYTFKHALVQDAAYSTLLKARRQQIHSKIATTLEENFLDMVTAQPALLAHHCTQAGLVEKAVGYWLKAGQLSVTRSTMTEAVAQLKKGLELLGGLPNGTQRQEQELALQITLGQALIANKGYAAPEPGESYDRARQLCQHLNRPQQLGQVLVGQFVFRLARAELEQAERHAEELHQLGEARNDAVWKCFGFGRSGTACDFLGKLIEARAHFEKYLSLWNPTYRAFWPSPEDVWVANLLNLSRTLLCLGYIDQALLRRNQALAEARRLSPFSLAHALAFVLIGDLMDRVRSAEAMLRSADELLATADEHGFPQWLAIGNILRGWCLGAMGQPAAGIAMVLQGLGMHRAAGANLLLPFFLTTLAELYGMAGRPDEGLNVIAEAAKLITTSQERWAEAEMDRVRGTLFLLMNGHAAAEDSFLHALTVARRQSAKFWELRAALDLARLWRHQGKRAEARDLLAPIYGWFTEGSDTPVLQDAKALLDQLT